MLLVLGKKTAEEKVSVERRGDGYYGVDGRERRSCQRWTSARRCSQGRCVVCDTGNGVVDAPKTKRFIYTRSKGSDLEFKFGRLTCK